MLVSIAHVCAANKGHNSVPPDVILHATLTPLDRKTAYTILLLAALLQRKGGQCKTSVLTTFEVRVHNYIASTFKHALDMQLHMHATNNDIYTALQGEAIDIDKSLQEVDLAEPYIAAFGVTLDSITDTKLVIEKDNILNMPSLSIALHCCFASYFLFNISYPPHFVPVMLFLEKYVYGMTPSQKKLPISVCTLIDSLDKA